MKRRTFEEDSVTDSSWKFCSLVTSTPSPTHQKRSRIGGQNLDDIQQLVACDQCSSIIAAQRYSILESLPTRRLVVSQMVTLVGVANFIRFLDWQLAHRSGGIGYSKLGGRSTSRTFVRNVNPMVISQFCSGGAGGGRGEPSVEASVAVLVAQTLFKTEELVEVRMRCVNRSSNNNNNSSIAGNENRSNSSNNNNNSGGGNASLLGSSSSRSCPSSSSVSEMQDIVVASPSIFTNSFNSNNPSNLLSPFAPPHRSSDEDMGCDADWLFCIVGHSTGIELVIRSFLPTC